jgi:Fe-S cluster biogenesis protein NfuA
VAQVVVQTTPNPRAFKFVTNTGLLAEGYAEFFADAARPQAPLLELLFGNRHVAAVFITGNSITVTLRDKADGYEAIADLRPTLVNLLQHTANCMGTIAPLLYETPGPLADLPQAEFFRTRILPATAQDGGAIFLHGLADGALTVRTAGACTTCPYLPVTIEKGILEPLGAQFPDLKTVVVAKNQ